MEDKFKLELKQKDYEIIMNTLANLEGEYTISPYKVKKVIEGDFNIILPLYTWLKFPDSHPLLAYDGYSYAKIINIKESHYVVERVNKPNEYVHILKCRDDIEVASRDEVKWLERGRKPFEYREGDIVKDVFSKNIMCVSKSDEINLDSDSAITLVYFVEDRVYIGED